MEAKIHIWEKKVDLFYVTLTFHTLVFSGMTTVFCVEQPRISQMTGKQQAWFKSKVFYWTL